MKDKTLIRYASIDKLLSKFYHERTLNTSTLNQTIYRCVYDNGKSYVSDITSRGNTNKQFRNEWKYCCSESTLTMIEKRLKGILDNDENSDLNGKYEIHSLYFDDIKNSCAKENEAGTSERFKYRIRYYGNNIKQLKLERKEKINGRCYKDSCIISLSEYEKIVRGDADELYWENDNSTLRLFCIYCMTKGFSPKAIIDYERTAFVEKISNVRITIDRNISVSEEIEEFITGNYLQIPIQEKHQHVLEVKFDNILPSYMRHVITNRELVQTAFSKYYLGRQQLQGKRRII